MNRKEEMDKDLEKMIKKYNTINLKIKDVREFEYEEKEIASFETQTYKHLIEHDGHAFLMETTFDFQRITFDRRDGFVPHIICMKIRPIDIKEKDEDE